MKSEVNAVMLFIAELTGSFEPGSGTVDDKIQCGQQDYIRNNLHDLDLDDEEDRKDLHENVWLERLYDELDHYFQIPTYANKRMMRALSVSTTVSYRKESYKWNVPIEMDATSSMCQIIGVLLNDKRLMNMTNVIGETLEDAWKVEGLSRAMLKKAATPQLYGSSQACHQLWQDAGMDYTAEDVALYSKEMKEGAFGLANLFKEFIINNCNPKAVMEVEIWNDKFEISCNRFRNVGEKTRAYKIWDSIDKQYKVVLHTDTKKVPDLEQFKRYFVTLLVHNIDSQIMDKLVGKVMDKYGWAVPIHDAIICSPAAAADVRTWYGESLQDLHANRKEVLTKFFKSIGITAAAKEQWDTLRNKVEEMEGDLEISMPLK